MSKIKYYFSKLIKKLHFPSIKDSIIDKRAHIGSYSQISFSKIDKYTYVGNFSNVNYTKIGKFCSIADRCIIGGAEHPIDYLSTSPVFLRDKNILKTNFSDKKFKAYKETFIGNDVWIGAGVYIKSGVKILDGSIIGMGSVVTKDIPKYEIWAGNPARFIRKRFDENTIENLNKLKWWDYEDKELVELSSYVDDIEKILEIKKKT